jgi:hypothetical protein
VVAILAGLDRFVQRWFLIDFFVAAQLLFLTFWSLIMGGFRKVLGTGTFYADRTGSVVTVHAVGIAPNFNYQIKLEPDPADVWPPEYSLFYRIPEVVLPTLRFFHVEANFHARYPVDHVVVTDATGRHAVDVREDLAFAAPKPDEFIVIARVGTTPPSGCHVIPADNFYIQTHYKAYGPSSESDCQCWRAGNCNPAV